MSQKYPVNIGLYGKYRTDTHLSMDEGFALRDRLAAGETIDLSFRLEVEEPRNIATEYTVATLPGMSDEQIVVMSHTDGYFQAATDNAAGMASALELARFFAERPPRERPRTLKFIQFPDHHHGEVARGRAGVGIDDTYPWDTVAVKLTMEHPAQTLLYMYNDALTPTNAVGAFRWNALGSAAFEQMVFDTLREFGVSVYALENGPKNGNYAPSFHIIDHVIYHTSLDTPELVPASGLERSTRAFAAALDRANGDDDGRVARGALPAQHWPGQAHRDGVAGEIAAAAPVIGNRRGSPRLGATTPLRPPAAQCCGRPPGCAGCRDCPRGRRTRTSAPRWPSAGSRRSTTVSQVAGSSTVNVNWIRSSATRVNRSTTVRPPLDPCHPFLSLKWLLSMIRVSPSQRARESPGHWRISSEIGGRPSIGIIRGPLVLCSVTITMCVGVWKIWWMSLYEGGCIGGAL